MRIRIGITQTRFNSTFLEYKKWVESHSEDVEIITLQTKSSSSLELPLLDGIIFTGGADIHPSLYNYPGDSDISERDLCESIYFRHYGESIPVLGICRGMQLINSLMGGNLYTDLVTDLNESYSVHLAQNKFSSYHKIISSNSSLIPDGEYLVNSRHHQAVRCVANGLEVIGKAEDGTVEILEDSNKVLVQFHPEKDDINEFDISKSILSWFISASRDHSK